MYISFINTQLAFTTDVTDELVGGGGGGGGGGGSQLLKWYNSS